MRLLIRRTVKQGGSIMLPGCNSFKCISALQKTADLIGKNHYPEILKQNLKTLSINYIEKLVEGYYKHLYQVQAI